ncbi:MAG: type II toxin-antitoxin system RelE/ParE family toxin [Candidatus Dadabacteria bacterium]|nr:type II toxin-antitoxin system RelE/ParE family toxin [Candidatus Dadabacteria bacterium]NIS07809.1 type II toxin-antitoxin system RelE/ParE family toxin [Candidatus Dadabacteria bacterium]NIV43029.1 type II toxin-antitoxin system RelE/ParE family toxin [Candidatus Dadabacteria bacterium]NIY21427.1 type II toxin-antitoxin system RelE/ParE family toxin [Candidatus Dadabacteria bacterium]
MSSDKKLFVSPLFGRKAKKFSKKEKEILDEQIQNILDNPDMGEEKKGDLLGVRVHKFKTNKQQMLLAYEVSDDELLLLTVGSYENYYRDLNKYLKG